MAKISKKINGIEFDNPFILASGIRDETGKSMKMMASLGAGGIVTKSVGPVERKGNKEPVLLDLGVGLINSMGLPNPGIKDFEQEVDIALGSGVPIIGSVFGPDIESFANTALKMADFGVSAVELNLSCPNAEGTGIAFGKDSEIVEKVTREVKKKISVPLWVKLTPAVGDIRRIGKAAVSGGADSLVAVNTMPAMKIDIETGYPVLGNGSGGLSGPALRPMGIKAVWDLYSTPEIDVPIIGVGGIVRWQDAVEYLMAGASLLQIGSGVYFSGEKIFSDLSQGLNEYLDTKKIDKLDDLIGLSHDRFGKRTC